MRIRLALILTTCLPLAALAKSPSDIANLVGARAPGAESEMQRRGYVDVGGNNTWWNAATRTCVKVRVSQGRYASVTQVGAATCQRKAGKAAK